MIKNFGGPEVLEWGEVEVADPGPGEVRLRQRAVGMNMMEVGLRMGCTGRLYPSSPAWRPPLRSSRWVRGSQISK